ncbi:acyltransferase family protein [Microbacterium sp. Marseille-Q6965]|uniref:acyltransferase family protein n=1 Tax=Microbacterium sp. Marseille-Q6965 TaxID=2965072 RepID=UPI0021B7818A|nr:acyltransferase family protein [Microbacterium sp. Marseille-Q6965]
MTAARSPESGSRGSGIRTDIQALRAFAVMAVVGFHLWPLALPGGYVGVDVFFVISGFLITGQLVRARESGTLKLSRFWAARARRLLPASLLVLIVSVALTLIWAPPTVAGQYLRSIIGSALYVENWLLAADGVDYLAHDNQPPIAQHYWSLSAEEQFYILWPLLVIAATLGLSRSVAAKRRALLITVTTMAALSFAVCVWLTAVSYPFGYFSTVSRIWQFALGAVIALTPQLRLPRRLHIVVWSACLVLLTATAFLFGPTTPFPGPWAILPTAATALFIALGPNAPARAMGRAVALPPVQWVGEQSYGIYLWHWPLIVIAPAVLGHAPDLPHNLALLALTIVLAALSKRYVEDPIRFGPRVKNAAPARIAITTAAAMIIVVAAAAVPMWQNARAAVEKQAAVAHELADPADCRGAHLLLAPDCEGHDRVTYGATEVVPTLAGLMDDTGGAYGCYDYEVTTAVEPESCSFGSSAPGALRIALNGDSHGAMLIPGLRDVAEEHGWSVDTYVGRGCVWRVPGSADCASRYAALDEHILHGGYDVLLVTALNAPDFGDTPRDVIAAEYAAAWRAAEEAGIDVVVLADNPNVPQSAQDCSAVATEFDIDTCAFPVADAGFSDDPLRLAAELAGVPLIDLHNAYCLDGKCPMALGGVLVYRDTHHITATFSRTLAPYLADALASALTQP